MYKCCTRAQYETLFSSCFWTIIGGYLGFFVLSTGRVERGRFRAIFFSVLAGNRNDDVKKIPKFLFSSASLSLFFLLSLSHTITTTTNTARSDGEKQGGGGGGEEEEEEEEEEYDDDDDENKEKEKWTRH